MKGKADLRIEIGMNGKGVGKLSGDEVCCSWSMLGVKFQPERKDCGIVGGGGECHVVAGAKTTCQHGVWRMGVHCIGRKFCWFL